MQGLTRKLGRFLKLKNKMRKTKFATLFVELGLIMIALMCSSTRKSNDEVPKETQEGEKRN